MTLHELNELAHRYVFDFQELQELNEKYPSARKEFVEQVLNYVKQHGVGFSFAFNLMEMDKDLLTYYGLSAAQSNVDHVVKANAGNR